MRVEQFGGSPNPAKLWQAAGTQPWSLGRVLSGTVLFDNEEHSDMLNIKVIRQSKKLPETVLVGFHRPNKTFIINALDGYGQSA